YAYRFGPPAADVVHARLRAGDDVVETHWFPAGCSAAREPDVGLAVTGDATALAITTRRFARFVAIDAPGYVPSDNYFHLAPDQRRTLTLTGPGPPRAAGRGLNPAARARSGSPSAASTARSVPQEARHDVRDDHDRRLPGLAARLRHDAHRRP